MYSQNTYSAVCLFRQQEVNLPQWASVVTAVDEEFIQYSTIACQGFLRGH